MNTRLRFCTVLWTGYTALNFFLLYKLEVSNDLRADISVNHVKDFKWFDFPIFLTIILAVYIVYRFTMKMWISFRNAKPARRPEMIKKRWDWCKRPFIWGFMILVWSLFFLVFFPGTAMNDTIYILGNPWELSAQHPILYNLYTYGLFSLGKWLLNPNAGLAIIAFVQILVFSYVLSSIISYLHIQGVSGRLCGVLTLYFSCAPIFPTYAVSAVKDTPFTLCLLGLMFLLYRFSKEGVGVKSRKVDILWFLSVFGISCFRSNGKYIAILTLLVVCMIYGRKSIRPICSGIAAIGSVVILSMALMPENVTPWFQESVGMQIQQLGAVVAYDGELEDADRDYLYSLLPEEEWKEYAPCCADVLKWDSQFNRDLLNETKGHFLSVWLRALPKNIKIYADAYLLDTYGFWGIETRNSEQYYVKAIFNNDLELYQHSLLPETISTLIYKYYCNRFTYGYLSAGTGIWFLFSLSLYLWYKTDWKQLVILVPVWGIWLTLMLETPIAFCFRYVYILQFVLPIGIILLYKKWKEEV